MRKPTAVIQAVILLLGAHLYADAPAWFYNLESPKNILVGYGTNEKQELAKEIAIAEIAKSLLVHVDASVDIEQTRSDEKAKSRVSQNISTAAAATLSGIKVLRAEKRGGLWYVAVVYDNTPLVEKFCKLLNDTQLNNEKQHPYLAQTELVQALNEAMGKTLDYGLIRQDNLWQLRYKEHVLPLRESDLIKLFAFARHGDARLSSNRNIYEHGDPLTFDISVKNSSYVSLIGVEQDGKTGVFLENLHITRPVTYPDQSSDDRLLIANPAKKTIYELYVLLQSLEPIRLNDFEAVHEEFLDESNYGFDKLLELMEKHSFSTVRVKIK